MTNYEHLTPEEEILEYFYRSHKKKTSIVTPNSFFGAARVPILPPKEFSEYEQQRREKEIRGLFYRKKMEVVWKAPLEVRLSTSLNFLLLPPLLSLQKLDEVQQSQCSYLWSGDLVPSLLPNPQSSMTSSFRTQFILLVLSL
jgi:hypothetical protein